MNDVIGYALIKSDAKTIKSALPDSEFAGKIIRVIEFACDGGILAFNNKATGLAMIDACDIQSSFKCTQVGGLYICPPNLSYLEQMAYVAKCAARKGGYNEVIRQMVIGASLHKNTFNDTFLWINS